MSNVKLHCYASGSGALSFVYVDTGIATAHKVTEDDVINYLKDEGKHLVGRFKPHYDGAHWKLIPTVGRLDENTLTYEGTIYQYKGEGYLLEVIIDGETVRNLNTLAALRYFLENEEQYK